MRDKGTNTVWFHLCKVPRVVKFIKTKVEWWLSGTGGEGNGELVFNGDRLSVWEDGNFQRIIDGGDGHVRV